MLLPEHFVPHFPSLKQNLDGLSQHGRTAGYRVSESINDQCIRPALQARAGRAKEKMKQSESYLQIVVLMFLMWGLGCDVIEVAHYHRIGHFVLIH